MSWIDKILPSGISRTEGAKRSTVPEGVWTKCIKCESVLYRPDLERNAMVCPKCEHHMRLGARRRLDLFLDEGDREEVFSDIEPIDRLRFRDKKKYVARLAAAQKSTGERDALVAMRGTLHGIPLVVVAFEFSFHGGSMGQAVGEKFSQAAQLALKEKIPLVCFAASGGARMQEALISLMQMAKTSAVIERMHSESVPYISVLTDPIYGGVSASLALLGDLNIAEPDARAGFAGPNIIEQTIRQKLPKGFQRSEFLMEHGAIDMIVPRLEMRDTIAGVLAKMSGLPPLDFEVDEADAGPVEEGVEAPQPETATAEAATADDETVAGTDAEGKTDAEFPDADPAEAEGGESAAGADDEESVEAADDGDPEASGDVVAEAEETPAEEGGEEPEPAEDEDADEPDAVEERDDDSDEESERSAEDGTAKKSDG